MSGFIIVGAVVALALGAAVVISLRAGRPQGSSENPPGSPAPAQSTPVKPNGNGNGPRTPTPTPSVSTEQLEESRHLLFRLIAELGSTIQQLVGVAAKYDAGLEQYQNRLKESPKREDLEAICNDILTELQDMRAANARYKAELADTQQKLREREAEVAMLQLDMNTDYLTRILNRRGLEARIHEEMARSKRYDAPFSVAIFDIDHFKDVNDEHGHEAGDKVLRLVAHTLEELKRTNDAAGRYGGEEFMLLLPAASSEQAMAVAERARRQMERFVTRYNDCRIRVTISGGVTQFDPEQDSLDTFVRRADKALYSAKQEGRNRINLV